MVEASMPIAQFLQCVMYFDPEQGDRHRHTHTHDKHTHSVNTNVFKDMLFNILI